MLGFKVQEAAFEGAAFKDVPLAAQEHWAHADKQALMAQANGRAGYEKYRLVNADQEAADKILEAAAEALYQARQAAFDAQLALVEAQRQYALAALAAGDKQGEALMKLFAGGA